MTIATADIERLARTRTVDLTTIGRRSGLPRTVEIWWFHVDGRFIITGTPGTRDWLANVRSNPEIAISDAHGTYSATVIEIDDKAFKRRVFEDPEINWYKTQADLDHLIDTAPMIEVHLS
ncbi:MAG: nitroreductase/quinone reductase family protein [Acidimicrobiia bacterium]